MIHIYRRIFALLMILMLALPSFAVAESAYAPLQSGNRGEAVLTLQTQLSALGYYPDRLDGIYGSRTKQAINRFQKASGLRINGIASIDTQKVLFDPSTEPALVYLSPHGRRYHARENCRGLSLATSVEEMSFPEAEAIRTPCIICYGRLALRIAEEKKALSVAPPEETDSSEIMQEAS